MSTVLASALPEKPVLSADGRKLGIVRDLTIDPRTGEFETLLVDPTADATPPADGNGHGDAATRGDATTHGDAPAPGDATARNSTATHGDAVDPEAKTERDDGAIRLPGDAVTAVGDQVIVDLSGGRNR